MVVFVFFRATVSVFALSGAGAGCLRAWTPACTVVCTSLSIRKPGVFYPRHPVRKSPNSFRTVRFGPWSCRARTAATRVSVNLL